MEFEGGKKKQKIQCENWTQKSLDQEGGLSGGKKIAFVA